MDVGVDSVNVGPLRLKISVRIKPEFPWFKPESCACVRPNCNVTSILAELQPPESGQLVFDITDDGDNTLCGRRWTLVLDRRWSMYLHCIAMLI